jgi:hypothetical protein
MGTFLRDVMKLTQVPLDDQQDFPVGKAVEVEVVPAAGVACVRWQRVGWQCCKLRPVLLILLVHDAVDGAVTRARGVGAKNVLQLLAQCVEVAALLVDQRLGLRQQIERLDIDARHRLVLVDLVERLVIFVGLGAPPRAPQ